MMKKQVQENSKIPEKEHVLIYFADKKMPEVIAEKFFDHYQSIGWKSAKGKLLNWKKEAVNWIWKEQERMRKLKKMIVSNSVIHGRIAKRI